MRGGVCVCGKGQERAAMQSSRAEHPWQREEPAPSFRGESARADVSRSKMASTVGQGHASSFWSW